jgi:hypothetical protein
LLNLNSESDSYLYGLLLADGSLYLNTRNRGKITIELAERDKDILYKISEIVNGTIGQRNRKTNFTNGETNTFYHWANSTFEFRTELIGYGFPTINKSLDCSIPNISYNEKGFWRGYFDGNGSLGMTNYPFPFLSITMKSESLKDNYLKFLLSCFGINKNPSRNKRDNIYNICIFKEDAQIVARFLYENSNIFIQRKYELFKLNDKWVRPNNMPQRPWFSSHNI